MTVEGDWPRLERFLDGSSNAWLYRSIVTDEVVDLEIEVVERWVEATGSPHAKLFLAQTIIRNAFTARRIHRERAGLGIEFDEANGADPIDGFERTEDEALVAQLSLAEELLYDIIGDRPAMTEPWIVLLSSGRGLQVDLEELRQRFESAHSRSPFAPDACINYLQGLTKRWGGSNVASFDLAQWLERAAPATSPARLALPMAHIERGLLDGMDGLSTYLGRPDVHSEMANGLMALLDALPTPVPVQALGVLNAYVLGLPVNGSASARLVTEALELIDNRPTEWPWSLLSDDITAAFSDTQATQLRAANRF